MNTYDSHYFVCHKCPLESSYMDVLRDSSAKPVGRTKSARIANHLEELILSKELVAGHTLPSQQELADRFGASSRSVREAFKQLEAKGLLEVSQGRPPPLRVTTSTSSLSL